MFKVKKVEPDWYDPWARRQHRFFLTKKAIKAVVVILLVALAICLIGSGHAESTMIPADSLVFMQLQSTRDDGENEVLALHLEKGAVYQQTATAERIIQIIDLNEVDDQTALPDYDKFRSESKLLDLDKFVKKLDRKTVALEKVTEAGQYLWDLSESLNSKLDNFYQEHGVYDKMEKWGVADVIRNLFGTNK